MLFFGFLLLLGSLTAATISEGGISFSIILITIGGSIVAYVYFETRTNNRVNAASNAGNYIVGLPGIDNPVPNIMLKVEKPEAVFYQVQIDGWKENYDSQRIGSINLDSILDVRVVDKSFIQQKYAGAVGVRVGFAFIGAPVRSQSYQELCYVVATWREGRFDRETIFEFAGPGSHPKASALVNKLITSANSLNSEDKSAITPIA